MHWIYILSIEQGLICEPIFCVVVCKGRAAVVARRHNALIEHRARHLERVVVPAEHNVNEAVPQQRLELRLQLQRHAPVGGKWTAAAVQRAVAAHHNPRKNVAVNFILQYIF